MFYVFLSDYIHQALNMPPLSFSAIVMCQVNSSNNYCPQKYKWICVFFFAMVGCDDSAFTYYRNIEIN